MVGTSIDTTEQDSNISFDWQRGFAAGINACEDYLLSQMVSGGLLNEDYSGAAILDPEQSEKARRLLLNIVRKINAERSAASWLLYRNAPAPKNSGKNSR